MNFAAILFFAAALFAVAADAQENLLKDGLKGWTLSNRKTIVLDTAEKLTDSGSLRLAGNATAKRVVKLEPNSVYKLSFSVKGKKISKARNEGARISVNCKNDRKWFRITSDPDNRPETGTFGWRKGSGRIDTTLASGTEIVLEFMLKGKGTVWYDDIKLEKLKIYKLPPEWSKVKPKAVFADSEVKVSEEYSIRLENANNSQIQIQKEIELEPGMQYELTYYLKGKELSDGPKRGACLLVCGADRKQWTIVPVDGKNTWQTGTFDWKQGKLTFFTKLFGCDKILILPTVNGKGTAWFDQIEVKKKEKPSAFRKGNLPGGAETVFYPLGISGFFLPDEPMRFRLESAGKGEADYIVRLKDFSGKEPEVVRKGKMTLPGQIQIDFPAMKQGYYVADADVFINGKAACFRQAGAVSAPEVKRRDPFFQLSYGVYSELHDAYKRAGVGTIALKLRCSDHLAPGRRKVEDVIERWLKSYEPFLNSSDFQLDLSIGTTMRHSSNPKYLAEGRGTLDDSFTDNILKGIRLAAERTKGKIKEWNIGSEIPSVAKMPKYLGTWSEAMYNQMVITRMASRIARQIDPGIKIYFGGNNLREYTSTIERFVFSNLVKEVDGYFIDAYTGNWDMMLGNYSIPEKSLRLFYKEASDLSVSFGKSPYIKNNETGYSINYGASFGSGIAVEQAELTARTIILTKAAPVAGFELHMPTFHHGLHGKKDDSGCMTTIWKPVLYRKKIHDIPLPGGAMYATAARELAFAQIRKELIVGSQYACVFARPDGKTVAAVWNIEAPQDLKIILNKKAQLIDMVGSESMLEKGEATLKTSTKPIYLVTEESPEYITQTLSSAFSSATYGLKCAAKLQDRKTVSLYIRNPGVKPVEAELIGDGRKLKQVTLLPGKINTFRVPLYQNFKIISNGKTYPVQPDRSYLKIQRIKNKPVFDGSGKWLTGLNPGKLRYPDDIYPKSALQPELCHFKTSFNPNGHNISADYYLAYDEENFYLSVTVDDPVHLQKDDKGNLWKGDSIQWVISTVDVPPKEVRPYLAEQKICSDLNFGLALTSKGPEFRRYLGKPGNLKYPCNVTRKGKITFYEAAIPWSELGVKPDSGKALRFSLVVFDKNSEKTKGCPYHLAVTPGVAGGTDDGEFRLMIFEKAGKAPEFAPVFNSGMVLQQGRELTIRGKANPEEALTLEFAGQKVSGKAGKDGRWQLKLAPLTISHTPLTMTLSGPGGTRKLDDILVGEVWLCSGQSNMYWPLNRSLNGKETAAASNYAEIRVFGIGNNMAASPQEKTSTRWRKLTPDRAGTMSAVAFYFGRKLYQELKIPIGLICAHRGGTMIEPWTPAGAWDAYPDLKKRISAQFSKTPDKTSKMPKDWPQNQPHVLYNGIIHPLTPYAFRGVIWYQGCSNVWYDSQEDYLLKQQALFDSWKKVFSNPEMKFYTVQIAPLKRTGKAAANHVGIWLAQQQFADANDPKVKLVVINDVGDLKNIHPANKEPVGVRLANLALKYDYGKNIQTDFPRCKAVEVKNGAVHLSFRFAEGWKTTDNGPVRNFEIAGPDGKFVPAQAQIRGAEIIVSATGIPAPAAVRYMYDCSRLVNLVNEAGLPLGTFEASTGRETKK